MNTTRRRWVVSLSLSLMIVVSGCITVSPAVTVEEDDGTGVFENVTTESEWGTSSVQATIRLSPTATTTNGVSRVNVITESGKSFYTTRVDAGQRTVSLPLPTKTPVTLYAVNGVNGSVVATQNVTVGGSTVP